MGNIFVHAGSVIFRRVVSDDVWTRSPEGKMMEVHQWAGVDVAKLYSHWLEQYGTTESQLQYIEIGTSTFDTLCEQLPGLGISVDMVRV